MWTSDIHKNVLHQNENDHWGLWLIPCFLTTRLNDLQYLALTCCLKWKQHWDLHIDVNRIRQKSHGSWTIPKSLSLWATLQHLRWRTYICRCCSLSVFARAKKRQCSDTSICGSPQHSDGIASGHMFVPRLDPSKMFGQGLKFIRIWFTSKERKEPQ